MRKIIPYNPKLKQLARNLRNNSTKSEVLLWLQLRDKQMMGFDFHRQKPIDNYILDFFCHELMLAIELDGITHVFDGAVENDKAKDKRLNDLGITVLRFNTRDVYDNMTNVIRAIEGYIEHYVRLHS